MSEMPYATVLVYPPSGTCFAPDAFQRDIGNALPALGPDSRVPLEDALVAPDRLCAYLQLAAPPDRVAELDGMVLGRPEAVSIYDPRAWQRPEPQEEPVNDTDTGASPGPVVSDAVYHTARRAFIAEVDRQHRYIDLGAMQMIPEHYPHSAHLKAEILDRVVSIVNAEADLAALLRPGLSGTDLAEVLTRWMLLLAGGSIDVAKAIRAVLEAAIPEIDKERDRRAAALDSMLGSAVLTAPGPGPESLTGPGTTSERIALLRQQVHRIEQAMLSQGVSQGVRDRVVSHFLYGEEPQNTVRSAPKGAAQ